MQQSIRAFLVGACLLAPQAVQSKKVTARAPGISHRSLQTESTEPPRMNFLFSGMMEADDDGIRGFLEGIDIDPALEQCILATDTLYDEPFVDGINDIATVTNGIMVQDNIDLENKRISVSVTYSDEVNQLIGNLCAEAGGQLEIIDQITCTVSDPSSGFEIYQTMSGVSECLASECGPNSFADLLSVAMGFAGLSCTLGDAPAVLPEPTSEGEPEVEEDSQAAEESGAVSGLHTTGLLVLTGIAAAASNLL